MSCSSLTECLGEVIAAACIVALPFVVLFIGAALGY